MISLNTQLLILLYSFLSGIIFGFGFDLYKIFILKSKNVFMNFINSSIFWIFVGVGIFYFLLNTQYAILSLYTYFYIFLGAIFYLKIISKSIFGKLKSFIDFILFVIRLTFKNIVYLFVRIFNKKINKSL